MATQQTEQGNVQQSEGQAIGQLRSTRRQFVEQATSLFVSSSPAARLTGRILGTIFGADATVDALSACAPKESRPSKDNAAEKAVDNTIRQIYIPLTEQIRSRLEDLTFKDTAASLIGATAHTQTQLSKGVALPDGSSNAIDYVVNTLQALSNSEGLTPDMGNNMAEYAALTAVAATSDTSVPDTVSAYGAIRNTYTDAKIPGTDIYLQSADVNLINGLPLPYIVTGLMSLEPTYPNNLDGAIAGLDEIAEYIRTDAEHAYFSKIYTTNPIALLLALRLNELNTSQQDAKAVDSVFGMIDQMRYDLGISYDDPTSHAILAVATAFAGGKKAVQQVEDTYTYFKGKYGQQDSGQLLTVSLTLASAINSLGNADNKIDPAAVDTMYNYASSFSSQDLSGSLSPQQAATIVLNTVTQEKMSQDPALLPPAFNAIADGGINFLVFAGIWNFLFGPTSPIQNP